MDGDTGDGRRRARTPVLAWLASALGLVLVAAMVGFLGWQSATRSEATPTIAARATAVGGSAGSHLVEVTVDNTGPIALARVHVEVALVDEAHVRETGMLAFDYIPGYSRRRGGVFFQLDPAGHRIRIGQITYVRP